MMASLSIFKAFLGSKMTKHNPKWRNTIQYSGRKVVQWFNDQCNCKWSLCVAMQTTEGELAGGGGGGGRLVRVGENAKPIEQCGRLHSPAAAPAQPQNR